jgi:hypothetical protein
LLLARILNQGERILMRLHSLCLVTLLLIFACSASKDDPITGTGFAGASGRVGDAPVTGAGGHAGRSDAGSGGASGGASDAAADGTLDTGNARGGASGAGGGGGQPPVDATTDGRAGTGGQGGGGAAGAGGAAGRGGSSGRAGGAGDGGVAGSGGAAGAGGRGGAGGSGGTAGTGGGDGGGGGNKLVIGYFAAWGTYARQYFVKNIDTSGSATRMTHINYAFANISSDLKCAIGDVYADYDMAYDAARSVDGVADTWDAGALRGSFNQLKKLKAKHPGLKILISLGGWTWSDKFSDAALTAESRRTFVKSCVDMFIKGAFTASLAHPGIFDGIDVDWEYPAVMGNSSNYRPEDTVNFTALLAEFRRELDVQGTADGKRYLLTIAAPAGKDKYTKIEIDKIHASLDFINIMTYDMHGALGDGDQLPCSARRIGGGPDACARIRYRPRRARLARGWNAAQQARRRRAVLRPGLERGARRSRRRRALSDSDRRGRDGHLRGGHRRLQSPQIAGC